MPVSPQDAAHALRQVERAEARSAALLGYQRGSPHLILWGLLWAVGYGLCDYAPMRAWTIWAIVVTVGLLGSVLISRGARPRWRFVAVAAVLIVFCLAIWTVSAPLSGRMVAVVIPLVVAAGYTVLGLWCGTRYVIAGLTLAALTLLGFFVLPAYFLLWMAVVGGGALVAGGIWLRKA